MRTARSVSYTHLAILALVCGYLFVWLVNPLALLAPYSLGVGVTIFAACFYTTALLYMRKQKISPPKSSYGWLGLSMVSALYFALFLSLIHISSERGRQCGRHRKGIH